MMVGNQGASILSLKNLSLKNLRLKEEKEPGDGIAENLENQENQEESVVAQRVNAENQEESGNVQMLNAEIEPIASGIARRKWNFTNGKCRNCKKKA